LEKRFKQFFAALLLTTALPFVPFVLPFFSGQFFEFNLTGWAWMIMLVVTLTILLSTSNPNFPILIWIPWAAFLIVYILIDFSFIGLQLTLQYLLPLLIGIVASGFSYSPEKIHWLAKWFKMLCLAVLLMFAYGRLFRGGYTPAEASVPMLLSIASSFLVGLYFITQKMKYLVYFGILFSAPFISVTRMGIAAFLAIFIFHFANQKIVGKIVYGLLGVIFVVIVFNSSGFQEKTFRGSKGKLSDLSFNYHENDAININGRNSWKNALEAGLKAYPIWGNGPRADNKELIEVTGLKTGEAHDDYMSVRYNYGYVGLTLLLFGFGVTFISIFQNLRNETSILNWIIGTSTLTLFIVFLMFMYSDNILKYTIYFPNYFFALIGIFFSINKKGYEIDYTDILGEIENPGANIKA